MTRVPATIVTHHTHCVGNPSDTARDAPPCFRRLPCSASHGSADVRCACPPPWPLPCRRLLRAVRPPSMESLRQRPAARQAWRCCTLLPGRVRARAYGSVHAARMCDTRNGRDIAAGYACSCRGLGAEGGTEAAEAQVEDGHADGIVPRLSRAAHNIVHDANRQRIGGGQGYPGHCEPLRGARVSRARNSSAPAPGDDQGRRAAEGDSPGLAAAGGRAALTGAHLAREREALERLERERQLPGLT